MTTPALNSTLTRDWRALLRKPTVLLGLVALVALATVWGVLLFRASQPETLDQRTRDVASQIQCPVCNGESVEDSPSGLAAEMRALIRQKLAQGESEAQVIQYFEARYGDTILESPPKTGFTVLIWLPPLLMLAVGAYLVFAVGREWGAPLAAVATANMELDEPLDLSDDERQRLRATLLRELERDEGIPFSAAAPREERN
ncbi:MAG TPA: cytochrome c-type biogenesis protein [Ktedonobacterales bacterium]